MASARQTTRPRRQGLQHPPVRLGGWGPTRGAPAPPRTGQPSPTPCLSSETQPLADFAVAQLDSPQPPERRPPCDTSGGPLGWERDLRPPPGSARLATIATERAARNRRRRNPASGSTMAILCQLSTQLSQKHLRFAAPPPNARASSSQSGPGRAAPSRRPHQCGTPKPAPQRHPPPAPPPSPPHRGAALPVRRRIGSVRGPPSSLPPVGAPSTPGRAPRENLAADLPRSRSGRA